MTIGETSLILDTAALKLSTNPLASNRQRPRLARCFIDTAAVAAKVATGFELRDPICRSRHPTFLAVFEQKQTEADIQLSRSRARRTESAARILPQSTRISSFGRLIRDGNSRASPTCDHRHP